MLKSFGVIGGFFKIPPRKNALLSAAAGDEQDGDDDEPDPVIAEEVTEAVIHGCSSIDRFRRAAHRPSVIILCRTVGKVYKKRRMSADFARGRREHS